MKVKSSPRRPANRKGRRSVACRGSRPKYLKYKSPHELSPGERTALAPMESSEDANDSDESPSTSQETVGTPLIDDIPSNEDEDKTAESRENWVRRSGRKRKTVEKLSPQDSRPSPARRSPYKKKMSKSEMVMKLMGKRPAAAAVAAARAEAAMKEKAKSAVRRKKAAAKKKKSEGDLNSPQGVLSPVQDEKKVTPKKNRGGKARRSLEPSYSPEPAASYSHDSQTHFVSDLIADLYEEQEQDDRGMYDITKPTVLIETSACKRSQEVQELNIEEFRRLMTYGEVSVESMASTILPFLDLEEDDVFFDLGCGTGKILVQAAIQTPCKTAVGIELMQNRVQEGQRALTRLKERAVPVLEGKRIEIFCGDIFEPPVEAGLMNATVVFINNVMFGPQLMLKVMQLLKDMSKLKRVVTLRKVCERHGDVRCQRAGNYCSDYIHPPEEAEIDVSWADKTSVYLYRNVDYENKKLWQHLNSSK